MFYDYNCYKTISKFIFLSTFTLNLDFDILYLLGLILTNYFLNG